MATKKTKTANSFPGTIFVYQEKDNDGSEYLLAFTEYKDAAELGETRLVGVYNLEKTIKVSAIPRIESTL